MKFSHSVDLALHALLYMACDTPDKPVMIKDLAKNMNASESYLARVMHQLAKAGILKSYRGKKGGFVFKKTPLQITIADVVMAIDKDAADYSCHWEERGCDLLSECALVNLFQEAQKQMLSVLSQMTVSQLVPLCNPFLHGKERGLSLMEKTAEKTDPDDPAPQKQIAM